MLAEERNNRNGGGDNVVGKRFDGVDNSLPLWNGLLTAGCPHAAHRVSRAAPFYNVAGLGRLETLASPVRSCGGRERHQRATISENK
jgi:hypothetical protein